jgi:aconitate hydratase
MGILPLQFAAGQNPASLGLTGKERYDVPGLGTGDMPKELTVTAIADDGKKTAFKVLVRIDTPQELQYYKHGGILEYVLRQLLALDRA